MKALSPVDSAFLWFETRSQPMHVAGLNLFTPPAGAGPDYMPELLAAYAKANGVLPMPQGYSPIRQIAYNALVNVYVPRFKYHALALLAGLALIVVAVLVRRRRT